MALTSDARYYDSAAGWQAIVYPDPAVNPNTQPEARAWHISVYSPATDRVYAVFGCRTISGTTCVDGLTSNSIWTLTPNDPGQRWYRSYITTPLQPRPRMGASAVYYHDGTQPTAIVFGGIILPGPSGGSTTPDTQVWSLILTSGAYQWKFLPAGTGGPPALAFHSAMIDSTNKCMWIFGGVTGATAAGGGTPSSALYKLDLTTWAWTTYATTIPARFATATVGIMSQAFVIAGGQGVSGVVNEAYMLNTTTNSPVWTTLAPLPTGVMQAAAFLDQGNVVVTCGATDTQPPTTNTTQQRYFVRATLTSINVHTGGYCGGTAVTVTGTGFKNTGLNVCQFGSFLSNATYVSSVTMTCNSAKQNTVVDGAAVTVGNYGYLMSTSSDTFDFFEEATAPRNTTVINVEQRSAGTAQSFIVQMNSRCGNPRQTGGDTVTVSLTGPATVSVNVTDLDNGQFNADFKTNIAGLYSIDMVVDSISLAPSGYTVTVDSAAPVNATLVLVSTPATLAVATPTSMFYIVANDVYGNNVVNPSYFKMTSYRSADAGEAINYDICATLGQCLVFQNGRIEGVLSTNVADTYKVHVYMKSGATDVELPNSPFFVNVAPGDPDTASFEAEKPQAVSVGQPGSFTIQPRDRFGNDLTVAGLVFVVTLSGPATVTGDSRASDPKAAYVAVTQEGSKYKVSYMVKKSGGYGVTVTRDGTSVKGFPNNFQASTGTGHDTAHYVAFGGGVTGGQAGKDVSFIVQAHDEYDNVVGTGGTAVLHVNCNACSTSSVSDNNDGTFTVSYKFKDLGYFGTQAMSVQDANNVDISGSPFTVKVELGTVFFIIIVIFAILFAIALAILATWGFNKLHRRYRYHKLLRDPNKLFPHVETHDPAEDPNDHHWAFDQDYMDRGDAIDFETAGPEVNDLLADVTGNPVYGHDGPPSRASAAGVGGGAPTDVAHWSGAHPQDPAAYHDNVASNLQQH